jgi:protein TonB
VPAATPEAPPAEPAQSGAVAQTTAPEQSGVPLSSLKFRRYVEPIDRPLSRRGDPPGWVELSFLVGTDGRTRDITVIRASPPNRYEDAALEAVRRWRFQPSREGGRTVERRTGVRLRFEPQ